MQEVNSGALALCNDMESGTVGPYFQMAHGMAPDRRAGPWATLASPSYWHRAATPRG